MGINYAHHRAVLTFATGANPPSGTIYIWLHGVSVRQLQLDLGPFLTDFLSSGPPPHVPCATLYILPSLRARLLDADWCLKSDGVADSPLQAPQGQVNFDHVALTGSPLN